MAQHQDAASIRSNSSDHPFPFQQEDSHTHPMLLPNGILNDEDDEVVPWPRRSSRADYAEQGSVLRVRRLPQDMTTREFAALFTFAEGYQGSDLVVDGNERLGIARFTNYLSAERAMHKMTSVNSGPYTQLSFEILNKRASQDMLAPPAAMSSSLKSNGSNSSMPQISRLSSYVKDKNLEHQNVHNDFYGSSSLPKSSVMNGSMTSNYSSNGGTVWSPTSPRFPADSSKSPPTGLSMLPPTIDEDAWNRTGQMPSMVGNRYSQQLSINTTMGSQDSRMTPLQSPNLSTHGITGSGYPSMDGNGNGHGLSRSNYVVGPSSANFPASPPKHYVTATQANGNSYSHQANYSARMGPPTPVNTNPADQNPPCNTLYVGNLPLATTEEELKSLFSRQPGYRRLCYRTKSNGPMCFVEFEDVHYAINSLKLLQGVILSSSIKGGIRLSFSKNPLGVRKVDSNQMLSHQPNHVVAQQTPSSYNGMHAPPGLQPDQVHTPAQSQHAINPIWR